ncbi:MAG: helix-turn-helix domain-containing protein [Acidovorax sp.]
MWDALADTPAQATNLRARAGLMQQIAAAVATHGWTQAEAARRCGVTQPRINLSRQSRNQTGHTIPGERMAG